MLKVVL